MGSPTVYLDMLMSILMDWCTYTSNKSNWCKM